ncbi:MAG: hypothetical protein DRN24_05050 [Thermoplasmata archaeon]|nr:MAG: hypothetical protein DRN24_05050 [Thermoplasmata archaeon]
MINRIIKTLTVVITVILLINPAISSYSFLKNSNQRLSLENNYEAKESKNIDQKIMQIIQMINETVIRRFLENLVSIGPRMTGTYGCEKAAEYIYNEFKKMGLDTRYHYWEEFGNKWYPRHFQGQNIEATLNGEDENSKETLIFNAHYDTVKVAPGANDDGSGVAAVLTAAYVLSQFEFKRTIKFVTFSGEEEGLLGSKAYTKEIYDNNEEVFVEFNADMIGYAETTTGGKTFKIYGTEDTQWMIDDIEKINQNYNIGFENLPVNILNPNARHGGSDYLNFIRYGYESIVFWQSEFNKNYFHTSEDTIEHVNFSYLVNTTRLIVGSLAYLADVEMVYPQVKIVSPKKGKIYFEDRIIKNLKDFKTIVIDDALIYAEVKPGNTSINKVEFYYDGKLMYKDTDPPYQWRLNKFSLLKHSVGVVVYDEADKTSHDYLFFTFINLNKHR